ncbi:MAG: hypothetical protein ACI9MC_002564 [Kiritimatiellia bacterium]|jgi:hypothetical protein
MADCKATKIYMPADISDLFGLARDVVNGLASLGGTES